MREEIAAIIAENDRRNAEIFAAFNPITGLGSIGERVRVEIADFPLKVMYIPVAMAQIKLVKRIVEAGSIGVFLMDEFGTEHECGEEERSKVVEQLVRLRCLHDFAFWAAMFVYIKAKGGGEDVLFRLTRPQRRFVERLEKKRLAGLPIRIVLLKARQWGGSTTSQIYMSWLQLCQRKGLNSLIIAHQGSGSDEIKDMFDRMISNYPVALLHKLGEAYDENEPRLVGVGKSGSIHRVPQRNCKIKIGTAERPDGCRGGDYNLVHLSEVGLWKSTDGKSPEDIVRSACSGVLLKPYTAIVYESTANGTGNFFQEEYDAAKKGESQFEAMFISWFDIDLYTSPLADSHAPFVAQADAVVSTVTLEEFAERLYDDRLNGCASSKRCQPGRYLWWLWDECGATLEAINWYVMERAKYNEHAVMASEYPSDDEEAFVHSGERVFDKYKVSALRKGCKPPKLTGDVYADGDTGAEAFRNIRFAEDRQGFLQVWQLPEMDEDEIVTNRYLTVVDIGGRSHKADWSVITVFDRMFMIDGDKPVVVAQWYGHIDIDLLAWKAGQIASFYDNALLVIESNTLETHDKERLVDGDQSQFVLNQLGGVYQNLYARSSPEDSIVEGKPMKYGFHTNINTKPMIISTLVKVVRESAYIERDERCLDEYLTYERKQNGSFGAIKGKHDDLLMTRAIGLHICFFEMELPKVIKRNDKKINKKNNAISVATI